MRRYRALLAVSLPALLSLCLLFSLAPAAMATPTTHVITFSQEIIVPHGTHTPLYNFTVDAGTTVTWSASKVGGYDTGDIYLSWPGNSTVPRVLQQGWSGTKTYSFTAPYAGDVRVFFYYGGLGGSSHVQFTLSYTAPYEKLISSLGDYGSTFRQTNNVTATAETLVVAAGGLIDCVDFTWFIHQTGVSYWHGNWTLYDGASILQQSARVVNVSTSGGYAQFYMGTYWHYTTDPNVASLAERVNQHTQAGHIYYLNGDAYGYDASNHVVAYRHSTITIRESVPAPPAQDWIGGVIWIMIFFIPVWMFNYMLPKFGLVLGFGLMSVVFGLFVTSPPGALWFALFAFLTTGSMALGMRGD